MVSASQKSFFTSKDHNTEFIKENKQTFLVHSSDNPLIITFQTPVNTNIKYGTKKYFEIEEFFWVIDKNTMGGFHVDYAEYGTGKIIDRIGTEDKYYQGILPSNSRLIDKVMDAYSKTPIEIVGYNTGDCYNEVGEQLSISQFVYPTVQANGSVKYFTDNTLDSPLEIKQPLGLSQLKLTFQWPHQLNVIDEITDLATTHKVPFCLDNKSKLCNFISYGERDLGYTIKFNVYDCSTYNE